MIRLLHKTGENLPKNFDLSSLKVLWSVWEPIDGETWDWYFETVGNKKASIVDTYWQTETGWHILSPLPFATPMKKRSATFPLPGICGEIVDKNWKKLGLEANWFFVISKPWPAMARGIWWDDEKFVKTYFSDIFREKKPLYFSGDGWFYDKDWYIFITGRVDDIVNISGHKIWIAEVEDIFAKDELDIVNISGHKIWIAEVEDIIAKDEFIAECALVGIPDDITGEALFGFVVLKNGENINEPDLLKNINLSLRREIGPIIALKNILIISELPKTRSGKIVRRILRTLAKGETFSGDASTLENIQIITEIEQKIVW